MALGGRYAVTYVYPPTLVGVDVAREIAVIWSVTCVGIWSTVWVLTVKGVGQDEGAV